MLKNRSISSSELGDAEFSMTNVFSTGGRTFLTNLAQDLHLTLSWDEYDDEDQNLVVLRFPGALESPLDDKDSESDSQDEAEAAAVVDRVLRRYDNAEELIENAEDDCASQEEVRLKQKMDEWKRAYYWVWHHSHSLDTPSNNPFRISSGHCTMTPVR